MSSIDRAIDRIAEEKMEVEDRYPTEKDLGWTDDDYLHGEWRGLKTAIEILKEERSREVAESNCSNQTNE